MTTTNVTTTDNSDTKQVHVKFTIPENWITSETRMMKRCDHIQSELVELYRRCMMIVTETELLREGIEQVAKTVPTYQIIQGGPEGKTEIEIEAEAEEEKPEYIEDLEQEEEEEEEGEQPVDQTNNRMSPRGL
jgi:hypothetical protein